MSQPARHRRGDPAAEQKKQNHVTFPLANGARRSPAKKKMAKNEVREERGRGRKAARSKDGATLVISGTLTKVP